MTLPTCRGTHAGAQRTEQPDLLLGDLPASHHTSVSRLSRRSPEPGSGGVLCERYSTAAATSRFTSRGLPMTGAAKVYTGTTAARAGSSSRTRCR
jgi:hypothetical protein